MAINIASTVLTGYDVATGDTFKAKYSATDILKIDSTGRTIKPNQIGFIAGNNTAAWIAPGGAVGSWANYAQWTGTLYNFGNCFANSRFTAPISGNYIFSSSLYLYNPSQNGLVYPLFSVNGSINGRQTGSANLRARMYSNAYDDAQITDVLKLTAGDYVMTTIYCVSATDQYYGQYGYFSGWLLG